MDRSADESVKRDALHRVLASAEFARSERLSSLLAYVCNTTLEQPAVRLSEQHLGVHVFGRPDNYIPADDTIVRTTAAMLRKRLVKYYEAEGQADLLRIAIPRGAYTPVFVPQHAVAAEHVALAAAPDALLPKPAAPEPIPPPARRRRALHSWRYIIATVGSLLLAGVAFALAPAWRHSDPVDLFWNNLLFSNRETYLVPADSELVMYQRAVGRQLGLGDYIAKRFVANEHDPAGQPTPAPEFRWRRYTGVISVSLAAELGRLSAGSPQRLKVRYARDLLLNDLKHANAVLVGIAEANPWVGLFRNRLNYHIDWDTRSNKLLVRNDKPAAGEQPLYEFTGTDAEKHGFAVLAYTPNLSGDGNVLMVGGTSSVGTEAAIDFLMNRDQLRPVLRQATAPDGTITQFEVLLQCVLQASGSTEVKVLGIRVQHR